MEKFRKTIKKRMCIFAGAGLIFLGITIYDSLFISPEMRDNNMFSFVVGFSVAMSLILAIMVIKYRKALGDEKALKLLHSQENDERMKAIRAKAGIPVTMVMSVAMILAGLLFGLKNESISITLIACGIIQMAVSCIIKLIYTKKM